jgi:tRNA-2-methylthio-N6-dimethylallyladenosine synthase
VSKGLYIKTFGCQMNVYDSQRMSEALKPLGFAPSEDLESAGLILINTCHIREKAAEKLYSELGRYRELKEERARAGRPIAIAVAGCVAQAEGAEILKRMPYVDIVVGPQSYHRLPEMVSKALGAGARAQIDLDFPAEPKFDHLPPPHAEGPSAFLTIQEGCDKFCTFCVVPYTRGAEYSRPVVDVLAEAGALVASGARELTLLGQNVNAYHGGASLGRLVRRLAEIPRLERIRYTTSHPIDVDDELIAAHGEVPELMPFLHLPVQSGSDRVLEKMNRHHRVALYMEKVERLTAARGDLRLSTDFIVGFPGESDQDFDATLRLAQDVGFIQAYSFKYSVRPGTPAATMPQQVPEDVKSERLAALQDVLNANQQRFNQQTVGRTLPVLFDRPGRHDGQLVGRTPYMQPVHVQAPQSLLGEIAEVRITERHQNSLSGTMDLAVRSQERIPA